MTGEPSYLELSVRDPDKARAFYGPLLGWTAAGDSGPGQVETSSLNIGIHGGDDSSLFEVFFAVTDLDVSMAKVGELGGTLVSEVHDSAGFGRWVECADDQGVRFGLREVG